MTAYSCRVCDANLCFENFRCMACGTAQAYSRDERAIVPLDEDGVHADRFGIQRRVCANAGLITIDLAESNDAHREKVRAKFDEPYRTMLGHFRHEIGNYYEGLLVEGELLTEANRRERSP